LGQKQKLTQAWPLTHPSEFNMKFMIMLFVWKCCHPTNGVEALMKTNPKYDYSCKIMHQFLLHTRLWNDL